MLSPAGVSRGVLESLLSNASEAELALLAELCMSMGSSPSSIIAQRYTTELTLDYEARYHAAHTSVYARWTAECPAFQAWFNDRVAVAALTGRDESYLLKAYCYTDDPIMVTLGRAIGAVITPLISGAAELLVDATVDWGAAWRNAGIRRGEAAQAAK